MHNLPPGQLATLLRGYAKGYYPTEAAVELLIAHDHWLHRPDFLDTCVRVWAETVRPDDPRAWMLWEEIPGFLDHAAFSGSEGRILRLTAELAGTNSGLPLVELLSSLDDRNSRLVLDAIAHTLQITTCPHQETGR